MQRSIKTSKARRAGNVPASFDPFSAKGNTMNATIDSKSGELVIRVKLNAEPQPSASGKTLVVASSHGNQPTGAQVDGKPVIVGLNAYIRP